MITKERAKAFKHSLVVDTLFFCKTILQSGGRLAISSLLMSSMISCGPGGGAPSNIQYITNNGADKKLPEDGGYKGTGGTGDGGGGQGILCSADTKNPQYKSKLFVRDIFEGIYNSKLTMKQIAGPSGEGSSSVSPESIKFLISTLKGYFGPALQQLEFGTEKFWLDFVSKISFLDDDVELYPSQDANSPIALPQGCKIVQIAYWDDSTGSGENGTLYVDREQWKKLNSFNKIALLAHEYFFKEARRASYKNSDFVRAQLAQLFSESPIRPLFPEGSEVSAYCKGSNPADPHSVIHLYTTSAQGKPYLVIPYFRSSNIAISSFKGRSFQLVDNEVQKSFNAISAMSEQEFSKKLNSESTSKVWSGYFISPTTNIKISLENPLIITKSREHKITKSDIRMKIFGKIKAHLMETAFKNEPELMDETQLMRAFILLNTELDTYIRNGDYPQKFPKWHSEIYSLIDKQKEESLRGSANFFKIVHEFPMLLYKYRMELLSEQELEALYADDKKYSEDTYTVRGIVRGEKGNDTINFNLACYKGWTVYASQSENNILNGSPIRRAEDVVPFKFQYSDFRHKTESFDETYYRNKIKTMLSVAVKGHGLDIDGLPNLESSSQCNLNTIDGCTDEYRLGYKLARTKSVNTYRCHSPNYYSERFEFAEDSWTDKRCIVIEIPEEKMYYEMNLMEERDRQDNHVRGYTIKVSLTSRPSYISDKGQQTQTELHHNPLDPGP